MQTLSAELKNTPWNASQVPCSVSEALNREETLSVPRKVLADNSSDENLLVSGSSRTEPVSICYKNFPLLTKEHDSQLSSKPVYMHPTAKAVGFHDE